MATSPASGPGTLSAPPSGAAGGDLDGTYPNPGIGTGKVVAGDLASGVAASNLGSAGGDLTGTYPSPTLVATGPGATGPLGDSTHTPVVTIDAKGRVTALTSAAIASGSAWTTVTKSADESVNNSTTLQADDELLFTAVSGGLYVIEVLLLYIAAAGSPNMKIAFGEDATIRGVMQVTCLSVGGGAQTSGIVCDQATVATMQSSTTLGRGVHAAGEYVGAGGTFGLFWAQNTAVLANLTIKAGSILRYQRIV